MRCKAEVNVPLLFDVILDYSGWTIALSSSRRRCIEAPPRRTQVLLLCYRRNYDRSIAGLGSGKAQRYFASDFDRLSNRSFDASKIATVEVVAGSVQQRGTARSQPVQQCSTGSRRNRLDGLTMHN